MSAQVFILGSLAILTLVVLTKTHTAQPYDAKVTYQGNPKPVEELNKPIPSTEHVQPMHTLPTRIGVGIGR